MKINWKMQTIKFGWEGQRVEIKGDLALCCLEVTLKALMNSLVDGGKDYLVEYKGMTTIKEPEQPTTKSRLDELLREYEDLFRESIKLPPKRDHDHAIRLMPNVQPPNIRSYHYLYFQKNEVEKV